jgi:hypothetical protein
MKRHTAMRFAASGALCRWSASLYTMSSCPRRYTGLTMYRSAMRSGAGVYRSHSITAPSSPSCTPCTGWIALYTANAVLGFACDWTCAKGAVDMSPRWRRLAVGWWCWIAAACSPRQRGWTAPGEWRGEVARAGSLSTPCTVSPSSLWQTAARMLAQPGGNVEAHCQPVWTFALSHPSFIPQSGGVG